MADLRQSQTIAGAGVTDQTALVGARIARHGNRVEFWGGDCYKGQQVKELDGMIMPVRSIGSLNFAEKLETRCAPANLSAKRNDYGRLKQPWRTDNVERERAPLRPKPGAFLT